MPHRTTLAVLVMSLVAACGGLEPSPANDLGAAGGAAYTVDRAGSGAVDATPVTAGAGGDSSPPESADARTAVALTHCADIADAGPDCAADLGGDLRVDSGDVGAPPSDAGAAATGAAGTADSAAAGTGVVMAGASASDGGSGGSSSSDAAGAGGAGADAGAEPGSGGSGGSGSTTPVAVCRVPDGRTFSCGDSWDSEVRWTVTIAGGGSVSYSCSQSIDPPHCDTGTPCTAYAYGAKLTGECL